MEHKCSFFLQNMELVDCERNTLSARRNRKKKKKEIKYNKILKRFDVTQISATERMLLTKYSNIHSSL